MCIIYVEVLIDTSKLVKRQGFVFMFLRAPLQLKSSYSTFSKFLFLQKTCRRDTDIVNEVFVTTLVHRNDAITFFSTFTPSEK